MKFIERIITPFLDAMYPNQCMGCGDIIPKEERLCDFCLEKLEKTNFDKRCNVCGNKITECDCKYHVFHFTGLTAPFYNEGLAQQIMYDFKFEHIPRYADFFAERMAISVKTDFFGCDFDCAVYVPLTLRRELKRGYNQSKELARRVSRLLNIPMLENALGCNKKRIPQHKTAREDRFLNVKGVYYPNISVKGRRVLLVDDIKTTGATLDECARSLYKAGAIDVHCVTGLITRRKPKER